MFMLQSVSRFNQFILMSGCLRGKKHNRLVCTVCVYIKELLLTINLGLCPARTWASIDGRREDIPLVGPQSSPLCTRCCSCTHLYVNYYSKQIEIILPHELLKQSFPKKPSTTRILGVLKLWYKQLIIGTHFTQTTSFYTLILVQSKQCKSFRCHGVS